MPRKRNPLEFRNQCEDVDQFFGKWKIETAYYSMKYTLEDGDDSSPSSESVNELVNVSFTTDEQFDVNWDIPNSIEADAIPLFKTCAFDVEKSDFTLLGGSDGRSYTFEYSKITEGRFQLVCPAYDNSTLHIIINKVPVYVGTDTSHFSLLQALRDGYFSDLTLHSSQGQKFMVHRVILGAVCPGVKYRDWEMLLSDLPTETLSALLHYVYSYTLPYNLDINVAKEIVKLISSNPKLVHLNELCTSYIESNNLKKKMQELVDSLLHSIEMARQVITNITLDDPAKVLYTGKQLVKEAALGVCRFVLLCQLYTENKQEMTKSERKEVLEYIQGRVIVVIDQARELIQLLIAKWESITDEQKTDMAIYIIPEVERIWDEVNKHAKDIHTAMREASKPSHQRPISWKVSMVLQFNSNKKDLSKLKKINKEFDKFVNAGELKREWFMSLNEDEKVEKIMRIVHEMINDGEGLTKRLEDFKKKILFANALDWSSYKLGVSLVCSYISWGLNKLYSFKEPIKPLIQRVCHLIGNDEVSSILVQLALIGAADVFEDGQTPNIGSLSSLSPSKSASGVKNCLADGCYHLMENQQLADMEFIIKEMPQTPSTDDSEVPLVVPVDGGSEVVIPAHRVIVASRSEWFCKALQSGMIEDRNRRVIIQDVDASLFRIFLAYLYGKVVDYEKLTKDEIVELLAVADRYETSSLHRLCENQLIARANNENIFQLLVIGDSFNAKELRAHALTHVLDNPDVLMTQVDSYSNLPPEMKSEIRLLLSGTQDINQFRSSRSNVSEVDDELIVLPVKSETTGTEEHKSSHLLADDPEDVLLKKGLEDLRGIVGDEPSDDMLKDILLAADMDINRALNFFFGTQ